MSELISTLEETQQPVQLREKCEENPIEVGPDQERQMLEAAKARLATKQQELDKKQLRNRWLLILSGLVPNLLLFVESSSWPWWLVILLLVGYWLAVRYCFWPLECWLKDEATELRKSQNQVRDRLNELKRGGAGAIAAIADDTALSRAKPRPSTPQSRALSLTHTDPKGY